MHGKSYSQYPDGDLFNPFWYDSQYYYYEQYDLAIHITPIGGYKSDGTHFGVPITQKYKFSNIKVGVDKLQFDKDPDPYNKYSSTIDSFAEFIMFLEFSFRCLILFIFLFSFFIV